MRTWTPEARRAQAEAIRRWQPWTHSTGPRTDAGKARSRINAAKPHLAALRLLALAVRRQGRFCRMLAAAQKNNEKRTIMRAALRREGTAVTAALWSVLLHLLGSMEPEENETPGSALSPCGIRRVA